MNKTIKILIVGALLVGLFAFALFRWFTPTSGKFAVQENTNNYVVNFDELNKNVYIRAKSWGFTGDHEQIKLCSSPIDDNVTDSSDECLVLYTAEIYYKKKGTDRLFVYVDASAVPTEHTNFLGPIKLVVTELKNSDEIRDYATNYEKYGMSKATIYREK